jgi:RNA polymerase sigma factor (TIGR02999 family)
MIPEMATADGVRCSAGLGAPSGDSIAPQPKQHAIQERHAIDMQVEGTQGPRGQTYFQVFKNLKIGLTPTLLGDPARISAPGRLRRAAWLCLPERSRLDVMTEVSQILRQIEQGEPVAAERLLPLVYDELKKLAAARLAHEHPGQTLQPTALVHEAYVRLVDVTHAQSWECQGHFFAAAAEAMRRILVDAARRKRREKHGGDRKRVALDDVSPAAPDRRHDLLALEAALTRLAAEDPQAARLVELRRFTGLSVPEAAHVLGISPRTAVRVWAYARAWLHQEIIAQTDSVEF